MSSASTAPTAAATTASNRSLSSADSTRMSPVGLPTPTSTAMTVAPTERASALTVALCCLNASSIAAVTSVG